MGFIIHHSGRKTEANSVTDKGGRYLEAEISGFPSPILVLKRTIKDFDGVAVIIEKTKPDELLQRS